METNKHKLTHPPHPFKNIQIGCIIYTISPSFFILKYFLQTQIKSLLKLMVLYQSQLSGFNNGLRLCISYHWGKLGEERVPDPRELSVQFLELLGSLKICQNKKY